MKNDQRIKHHGKMIEWQNNYFNYSNYFALNYFCLDYFICWVVSIRWNFFCSLLPEDPVFGLSENLALTLRCDL